MIFMNREWIDPWSRTERCRAENINGERCRNKARKDDVGFARCWLHREATP